jgi:adenine phosphoribosyltransferase
MSDLKKAIRAIPDFPKPGILFYDITSLLANPDAYREAVDRLEEYCRKRNADKIVAIESRGFIFGGALADRIGIPFVPIRKPGKLPGETVRQEYELEYGTDAIEMHADAIHPGDHVLVIDDLIATGGTLQAACKLVERVGGHVAGIAALIELAFLPWRERMKPYDVFTLISYDSEKM